MTVEILHLADSSWGGVYQYPLSVIEALLEDKQDIQYLVVRPGTDVSNIPQDADTAAPTTGSIVVKNEDRLAQESNGHPEPGVTYDSFKVDGREFKGPSLSHQILKNHHLQKEPRNY